MNIFKKQIDHNAIRVNLLRLENCAVIYMRSSCNNLELSGIWSPINCGGRPNIILSPWNICSLSVES